MVNLPDQFCRWAYKLSKPFLYLEGKVPEGRNTRRGKLFLLLAILLYRMSYCFNKKNGAIFFVAKCYQSLGNHEKALRFLKLTWETAAFSPILFKELGTTCLRLGKYEEGLQFAQKEVSEYPASAEANAKLNLIEQTRLDVLLPEL